MLSRPCGPVCPRHDNNLDHRAALLFSFVQRPTVAQGQFAVDCTGGSLLCPLAHRRRIGAGINFNLGYLPVYIAHTAGRADAPLQRPGECHWEAQARSVVMTIWGRRSTGYPRCACPRATSGLVPDATPFCWRRPTYTATMCTTLPASFWGRSRSSSSISIPGTLPTRLWLLAAFWGWVKK